MLVREMSSANASDRFGWRFRPAPKDGGRDFGNANVVATPPDVATLVRETVQNSIDASRDGRPVTVRYTIIEIAKGSKRYDAFCDRLQLETLLKHVEGAKASSGKVAARLDLGLQRFKNANTLTLLRIDDYGTRGLTGAEAPENPDDESQSAFAALMRDNLNSTKQSSRAGGSFGLGKAVNWVCSTLSTVLATSLLPDEDTPERERGTYRTIGKAELTWHRLAAEQAFAGPGWFASGPASNSLWWTDDELAELRMDRGRLPAGVDTDDATGTSLLIVGFHDPQAGDAFRVEDVFEQIVRAAAKYFWPAVMYGKLRLIVEHERDGRLVTSTEVDPRAHVPEFCSSLDRHLDGTCVEELQVDGDVVSKTVPLRVVPTRKGVRGIEHFGEESIAECVLLVRAADVTGSDSSELGNELRDHVALVRGRLMVVKYHPRKSIMVGGRPFHGVLLAGEAIGSGGPERAAEQFLRAAEPPAHDDWRYGPELTSQYLQGSQVRLKELFDGVTNALREAIRPRSGDHAEGPEELRRLLSGGAAKGLESADPLSLTSPRASVVDGRWEVEAVVYVRRPDVVRAVNPKLFIEVESGRPIVVPWESIV